MEQTGEGKPGNMLRLDVLGPDWTLSVGIRTVRIYRDFMARSFRILRPYQGIKSNMLPQHRMQVKALALDLSCSKSLEQWARQLCSITQIYS